MRCHSPSRSAVSRRAEGPGGIPVASSMDDNVIRSMLKWPDVPDVYGWLQLDRRGNWRIRGASSDTHFEPIGNAALRDFIARNYAADERGRWFFQNGPQRVFVRLGYAPFVFRLENDAIVDHCGRASASLEGAWIDDEGSLVLRASDRVGLLDDRDLGAVAEQVAAGTFKTGSASVQVGRLASGEIEKRFGFVREPHV